MDYSPDVQAYLDALAAQRAQAVANGMYVSGSADDILLPRQVQEPASDSWDLVYPSEQDIRNYMSTHPTPSVDVGYMVPSWGSSRTPTGAEPVVLTAGGTYTLTDKNTGKTYTASTPEQVKALTDMARSMSGVGGNNTANWSITDASGKEVASDLPYTPSFLKQAGQTLSDIGVMALEAIPAVAGTAVAGPIGGALAAGLYGGVKTGDPLEALKAAGLSYATSLGTSALGNQLFPTGTGSSFWDKALGVGQDDFFGVDRFTGAVGAPYSGQIAPGAGVSEAVQVGALRGAPVIPVTSAVLPAITSGLSSLAAPSAPSGVEKVTVSETRPPDVSLSDIAVPALTSAEIDSILNQSAAGKKDVEQVISTGYRTPDVSLSDIAVPALTSAEIDSVLNQSAATDAAKKDGLTTSDYIRLGLTGAGLLGGLFDGGSAGAQGATGTIPQGFSTALPSTFSAKLPTGSDIPAFGGGVTPESRMVRTAADLGDIDYTRYGFGPERSFFANVPQRAAKGGSMAVKPISDGRSDDIPAVLSDGEYVMDAETVALLGNGSNKAGAAKLDRFRANIRKHKGKELAKGRFSVNAKNPQAYLAGGRT